MPTQKLTDEARSVRPYQTLSPPAKCGEWEMDTTGIQLRRIEDGELLVVTNCTEQAISVGTRLTQVIKHRVTLKFPDIRRQDLGKVASVDVLIEEITLRKWGPPAQAIPIGWSAALKLAGPGVDTVIHVLQDAAKDEQVFLR